MLTDGPNVPTDTKALAVGSCREDLRNKRAQYIAGCITDNPWCMTDGQPMRILVYRGDVGNERNTYLQKGTFRLLRVVIIGQLLLPGARLARQRT